MGAERTRTGVPPDPAEDESVVDRVFQRGDRSARLVREAVGRITPAPLAAAWTWLGRRLNRLLPKGLLPRSLLIVVIPMVLLQTVLASVFMERHYELVTARLSSAVSRDIGMVHDLLAALPPGAPATPILDLAERRLLLFVTIEPPQELPPVPRLHFTDPLLARTLSAEIATRLGRPFSVAVSPDEEVTVRVALGERGTLVARFDRNLAYAANWHIFIVWMVGTALILMLVSVLFLRNQIRPIQRLARAAEAFGRGRPVDHFVPQGAREVRRAAQAFIAMRRRIERQIEQRTTMLAGVSHDLRTMLTRLRLELAMMPAGEQADDMGRDIDEMEAMLEAYMAFAKGEPDEETETVDVGAVLADIARRHARDGVSIATRVDGEPTFDLRPGGFRRLVGNLVGNAARYGRRVEVIADRREHWLTLTVDDDGPGIPEAEREAVFRPFYRIDSARNQNLSGTGLGLAIARDVARSHGGDLRVEESPLGGARFVARLPG